MPSFQIKKQGNVKALNHHHLSGANILKPFVGKGYSTNCFLLNRLATVALYRFFLELD